MPDLPADHEPAPQTQVTFAGAPFAATSYARLRLVRQLHASGLPTGRPARRALPDGTRSASC